MHLHEAMRLAYSGRTTQEELAAKLGVGQNTISRWVTGASTPTLDQIRDFELAAGRPVGFVLRHAGYVADGERLEDIVDSDATIDDEDRLLIRTAVDFARFRATERRR